MSTIKVDTLDTRTGSGNITVSRPLTGLSGSGASLTALNATELTSGTVPDARFPATLPAKSGVNLTALNATNLGSGTVPDARFPATLPAASGVNLTALNATQLTSGTVADARISALTASKLTGALPAIDGSSLNGVGVRTNAIINGSFDVWQRGTSFAVSGYYQWWADRWLGDAINNTTFTASKQSITGQPFSNCLRFQRNNGSSTIPAYAPIATIFKTHDSKPYNGKTVTLSFYARKGANWSPASDTLTSYIKTGTGTDQSSATGLAGSLTGNVADSQANTLTTSWVRFSHTYTLPANITQVSIEFRTPAHTGTAGAADYFDISGVKFEVGSIVTDLEHKRYAEVLRDCQRYYQRSQGYLYTGWNAGTTYGIGAYVYPGGEMRTNPTCTATGNFQVEAPAGGGATASIGFHEPMPHSVRMQHNLSGMTTGHPAVVSHTNSSSYVEFDAEL